MTRQNPTRAEVIKSVIAIAVFCGGVGLMAATANGNDQPDATEGEATYLAKVHSLPVTISDADARGLAQLMCSQQTTEQAKTTFLASLQVTSPEAVSAAASYGIAAYCPAQADLWQHATAELANQAP